MVLATNSKARDCRVVGLRWQPWPQRCVNAKSADRVKTAAEQTALGLVQPGADGELPVRLLGALERAVPVEDEKTVARRVDQVTAEQRSRPACKPAPDHPWRRPFKPEAAGVAAG